MVKRIAIVFAYSSFFILALLYFTPKVNLYYFAETQLEQNGVVISDEDITDKGFYLVVEGSKISFKSVQSAEIGSVMIKIYGLYNSIYLNNITLSSTAKSFIPLHVQSVKIVYSILNPLNIKAHGVGEFGKFEASLNILDMSLHVELQPEDIMIKKYKNTLKNFTKNKDGEFHYDQNF